MECYENQEMIKWGSAEKITSHSRDKLHLKWFALFTERVNLSTGTSDIVTGFPHTFRDPLKKIKGFFFLCFYTRSPYVLLTETCYMDQAGWPCPPKC